ncbi:uncharacterized protein LOC114014076 [Falco peregrinus]|uniref:uncharacterized protein LOC114014076 n=1 Tax=Falco peregrinus TaxID=8954 RepID=UPI00247AD088|nr:uncharacterized protein LOC114014076 [Falco peregrinus]
MRGLHLVLCLFATGVVVREACHEVNGRKMGELRNKRRITISFGLFQILLLHVVLMEIVHVSAAAPVRASRSEQAAYPVEVCWVNLARVVKKGANLGKQLGKASGHGAGEWIRLWLRVQTEGKLPALLSERIPGLKISKLRAQKLFSEALLSKVQHFLATLIAMRSQEVALAGSAFASRSLQQLLAMFWTLLAPLGNKIFLLFQVGSLGSPADRGEGWWDWLLCGCGGGGWVGVVPAPAGWGISAGGFEGARGSLGLCRPGGRADVTAVSSASWVDSTSIDLQEPQDHVGCT